jgi:hypothetical protein
VLEEVERLLGALNRVGAGKWCHEVIADAGGASRFAVESRASQKRGRRW